MNSGKGGLPSVVPDRVERLTVAGASLMKSGNRTSILPEKTCIDFL
ncbi:hypothetical protein OFAG_02136 [Oxalobacter formigenes HOxBLS]|uniref:Uncharacterized protein n=1 Tax=Oxalobacter paraformigenes TaxID=556268 RepID=T5LQT7_9BURK|nr:hypothetical protein OFAG_02136 [Oxalobacter paraformigenes]